MGGWELGDGRRVRDDDRLPIKFGPVSNGEFHPLPHSPVLEETIRRTHRLADEQRPPARHLPAPVPQRRRPARPPRSSCSAPARRRRRRAGASRRAAPSTSPRTRPIDTGTALDELGRRGVHLRRADALRELRPRRRRAANGRRLFPHRRVRGGRGRRRHSKVVLHRRRVLPRDVRALRHVDGDPVGAADARRCRARSPTTWRTPSTSPPASAATAGC